MSEVQKSIWRHSSILV